jgi:hypothetical protein
MIGQGIALNRKHLAKWCRYEKINSLDWWRLGEA